MPNQELVSLYEVASKHSNYQILASQLTKYIPNADIAIKSRSERERLDFILSRIDVSGKTVIDIGGNTGFFTFELLDGGASVAYYYEGNAEHSRFVRLAADVLGIPEKITVYNRYYHFNEEDIEADIVLLLNVLHHIGDDYGDKSISVEKAKEAIIESLNFMAPKARYMVFQLGFCWKGDRTQSLFENGTKKELIDFVIGGTKENWEVLEIGIPEKIDDKLVYNPLNNKNIERNDSLGEFLNRPLFIMRSKKNA